MPERVEVLKSFNKTPQGNLADVGEVIEVEASRKEELIRNGLAKLSITHILESSLRGLRLAQCHSAGRGRAT